MRIRDSLVTRQIWLCVESRVGYTSGCPTAILATVFVTVHLHRGPYTDIDYPILALLVKVTAVKTPIFSLALDSSEIRVSKSCTKLIDEKLYVVIWNYCFMARIWAAHLP